MLAAAGQSIRVHDVATAAALRNYAVAAGGYTLAPLRVEGTRDDRLVFSGASTSTPKGSTGIYQSLYFVSTLKGVAAVAGPLLRLPLGTPHCRRRRRPGGVL